MAGTNADIYIVDSKAQAVEAIKPAMVHRLSYQPSTTATLQQAPMAAIQAKPLTSPHQQIGPFSAPAI